MSASLRLVHLLELADKGPALRAALAEEVAEMLTNWPADCPTAMRGTCEALLAQAARDVDDVTRARLRVRLYADPQLAARVLPREMPEQGLVSSARCGDLATPLSRVLGLSVEVTSRMLTDNSGQALAAAAKCLGLSRAAYSALALLSNPDLDPKALDAYDQVHAVDAAHQMRGWTGQATAA